MGEDGCNEATLATPIRIKLDEHEEATKRSATIQAQVERVIMKTAIPALVQAVRLEFDQTFKAVMSVMITTMRVEFDQEIRALMPAMVEEVLKKVDRNSSPRSLPHHVNSSVSMSFKLHFVGTLPDTLLTFNNIQDQGASLRVELQDSSGSRVEYGPEASVKIKIFVLHGEFEVDDTDDWTYQDFDKNVAQPRLDKGPLLKGKCELFMRNGVASVTDLAFTDNSKCMRNGTFRLGARVVKGLPPGVEIKDAVSTAFRVKERRVKSYRKHKSPSLEDATYCLKNVGHTLCLKFAANGIQTVKDLLQLYHTDANKLKSIIQVAENKWSELVKNAELCSLSDEHYEYFDEASGIKLLLDCVFNIVRVTFNGKVSLPYTDLDNSQKGVVNKIRLAAYEKRRELPRTCAPTIPTSVQAESVSQSTFLHSTTQHLDATSEDTATRMSCVNPAVKSMLKGPDSCRITPNRTDQGEEELLSHQIPPSPNTGLELLPLMPSEPGMPVDQTQDSNSQHQSFNSSPDSAPCEGAEACINENFRLGRASDTQVSSCSSNTLDGPISQPNKKRRLAAPTEIA